jgi:predicted amidohydrolase YtcJ
MKIYKGAIVSCDRGNNVWRYCIEDGGKIVFTGNELPDQMKDIPVTDLGPRALLPAFTDTHLHYSSFAMFSTLADVRGASSVSDTCDILAAYRAKARPKFILAFGASGHSIREKRLILRSELDDAFPDIPVMIIKYDGHASIANSRMLDILPGRIAALRGYHGDTGELNQEAFFAATDHITRTISPIALLRSMIRGYDLLAAKGFGCIHTVEGVGFPRDLDVDTARFVARGLRSGFRTKVFFQTMDVAKVLKRKLPRIGGCFATALDGCFGSVDAALREPYSHDENNRGVLFYSQDEVDAFCKKANRAGLQIQMHAIGDAAFDQAALALDAALTDFPRDDHRHTIIHGCLTTDRGLDICARRTIGIAAQSAFLDWPLEPAVYIESILGKRAERVNAIGTMRKRGLHVSLGSDAPCTIPDPVEWLYCACNHPVAGESIGVADALTMMTREAAWTGFDEREYGILAEGMAADMAVMSENPLTVPVRELRRLRVEQCILGGKPYAGGQGLASLAIRGLMRRG